MEKNYRIHASCVVVVDVRSGLKSYFGEHSSFFFFVSESDAAVLCSNMPSFSWQTKLLDYNMKLKSRGHPNNIRELWWLLCRLRLFVIHLVATQPAGDHSITHFALLVDLIYFISLCDESYYWTWQNKLHFVGVICPWSLRGSFSLSHFHPRVPPSIHLM